MKSETLRGPWLPLLGVPPGDERDAGWLLQVNLTHLEFYTATFEQAVRLADHAENLRADFQSMRSSQKGSAVTDIASQQSQSNLFTSWIAIAVRDAAMTVDHFEHLRRRINEGAKKIPTIAALVDQAQLKKAGDLFRQSFPDFEAIRDAVAHQSERSSSEQEIEKHSFSGAFKRPGIDLGGTKGTYTLQSGRTLRMSWKGRMVEFSADEATLDRLISVQQAVFRGRVP